MAMAALTSSSLSETDDTNGIRGGGAGEANGSGEASRGGEGTRNGDIENENVTSGEGSGGVEVGRMVRVRLRNGEERLGVVAALDPVSGGIALVAGGARGEKTGQEMPEGVVIVMGHAVDEVTTLPLRDDDAAEAVAAWAERTVAARRSASGSRGQEDALDNGDRCDTTVEVTRFAPSPSGHLHTGHALSALYAASRAVGPRDVMIVRMENLDADRCRTEYETSILNDMDWLGVPYARPVLRQSDRQEAYAHALERLHAHGVLYKCFCSRKDIASMMDAPHGPDGVLYPGKCRGITHEVAEKMEAEGKSYALRIDVAKAFDITGNLTFDELGTPPDGMPGGSNIAVTKDTVAQLIGDAVLARKDGSPAYHLSVVVDDAFQGVTRVTRGQDLYHATHLQRLLQALLGYPAPRYDHHCLVVDTHTGQRLAKRDKSTTLRDIRDSGITAAELISTLPSFDMR